MALCYNKSWVINMTGTVDFLMVTELNQILKERGIEYSLHTVGGCSSCGLQLRCDGQKYDSHKILKIINDYLASRWLVASYQINDESMLYIDSQFNRFMSN